MKEPVPPSGKEQDDSLEDLERLEQDAGFAQVMREVERRLLPRASSIGPSAAVKARCCSSLRG